MDRNKALDRIRKCMELSSSPEPFEAAAAMRQAQKLMEKFGVDERELGLLSYGKETVHAPVQYNRKKMPVVLADLIGTIMRSMGVKALVSAERRVSDYSYCIDYFGPLARVIVAKHTHEVLFRALTVAWDKSPYKSRERGARASFQIGWLLKVSDQVPSMVFEQEEKDKTEELVNAEAPNADTVETNKMKLDAKFVIRGVAAAKDFRLNRPVE